MNSKIAIAAVYALTAFSASATLAAPTLTTLVNFSGANGKSPRFGTVVPDASGNLYGTTSVGGSSGDGTIFEFTLGTNTMTTLASFSGVNGISPEGNVVVGASGILYGTTSGGGSGNDGTVYQLSAGTISNIISFTGSTGPSVTRGANPSSGLIADAAGNLYGATQYGGSRNEGTLYEVGFNSHALTTPVDFTGANGYMPQGDLVEDSTGYLYGTTRDGGIYGDGSVFRFTPSTGGITNVASFNNGNGANPAAGVLVDASGNIYGTTVFGGADNDGIVYTIASGTSTITTLATFDGTNGLQPSSTLIQDAAGDLFGTTSGGAGNNGTVFEVAAGIGTVTTLATFTSASGPSLIPDAAGNLYGITYGGGSSNDGMIFELTNSGFVVPEPASLTLAGVGCIALLRRRVWGSNRQSS